MDKKLVINENEASVVRRIYDLYENGFGYVKIATKLNDEGKKNKSWRLLETFSGSKDYSKCHLQR
ncbi:recombinase family protein [Bacillus paranthracis]